MWADNETCRDLIGFKVHADLVRSIISDAKMLPVTIGLFGDWGSGKTSVMEMLRRDLDPETWTQEAPERKVYEKIACLHFNGWLFEGYDDAKSAIITAILLALGEHKRFGPKVRDGVAKLLKSVNWMRAIRMGIQHVAMPALAAYVSGGATVVPSLVTAVGGHCNAGSKQKDGETGSSEPDKVDWEDLVRKSPDKGGPLEIRAFREQFGKLLADSDIDAMIVLVDDLDRCSPERVIENLEAIKLFLSVERTAFIIGADPRIVRHAIGWRYAQFHQDKDDEHAEEANRLVVDYLEKLIQVPYYLPRLSPAEVEGYMSLLFCMKLASSDQLSKCIAACDAQRSKDRYSVFGYGAIKQVLGEMPTELESALTVCAQAAPLITEGLKGNPRQIKRFLNALFLRQRLASVAGLESVHADVLVKLMILEYVNDRQFRQLCDWQAAQQGHPKQLRGMELAVAKDDAIEKIEAISKEWSSAAIRKWLAMPPKLEDVDLRDYFWVARDKLETTLSAAAMVPPVVRQAAEGLLSAKAGQRQQGMKLALDLSGTEVAQLLDLLKGQLERHPEQKNGFDAMRALVEADVPGAADHLSGAVAEIPLGSIPGSVGMDLGMLLRKKKALAETMRPLVERLRQSPDTLIGKAFIESEKG